MRWLALALIGCPRPVPDHLRVEPVDGPKATTGFTTEAQLVAALVGKDPLVRAPRLPDPAEVDALEGGQPIGDWIREVQGLEQGTGDAANRMQQVAERHPGTAAVALARGYRLRRAENRLGNLVSADPDEDPAVALAALLTPLRPGIEDPNLARAPLAFLSGGSGMSTPDDGLLRAYGDRWVLTGWLAAPDIPTAAVSEALAQPQYDGLAATPIGAILANRTRGTGDPTAGLADLERATLLSLTRTAADRDSEQAAWGALKAATQEELGGDPEPALLRRALTTLTAASADDRGAGGALVAASALRWLDACADAPCVGLDRTEAFGMAARFGPDVEALARVWQVIALKDALDTMDVGHDTILFPDAAVGLADALLGTGAGPLETGLLRRTRPDPAVWLGLARATGGEGSTDWPSTRSEIASHVESVVDRALALHPSDGFTEPLERIRKRALR